MPTFLHTEDKAEQRGRVEDGPVNLKQKFTEWPSMSSQGRGGSNKINTTKASSKGSSVSKGSSTPSAPSTGGSGKGGGK